MTTKDIAIKIYNKLNSSGAELGNMSIGIIERELDTIELENPLLVFDDRGYLKECGKMNKLKVNWEKSTLKKPLDVSPLEREYCELFPNIKYTKELQMDGTVLYYSNYVEWLENKINQISKEEI